MLLLCLTISLTAAATPPAIFWNSEGHVENTTVLALGGGTRAALTLTLTPS